MCVCVCLYCLDGEEKGSHSQTCDPGSPCKHHSQLYMCITTHSFSSTEYGIEHGIVIKAHDKLRKPGNLEHEDVLGREWVERKKMRKKEEIREE